MKVQSLSISFLLLFISPFLNAQYSYINIEDFKGKVKSIKEVSYEAVDTFGKINKGAPKSKYNYLLDKKRYFNKEGDVYKITFYRNGEEFEEEYLIYYDSNRRIIEEDHFDNKHKLKVKKLYSYSVDNKTSIGKLYNGDGSLCEVWNSTYDNQGNEIKQVLRGSDGIEQMRKVCRYDKNNNLILYMHKMQIVGRCFFSRENMTYNKDKRSKVINYDLRDNINLCTYNITTARIQDFVENGTLELWYNTNGLIEKEVSITFVENQNSTKQTEYEYLYDHTGNWIQKIVYEDFIPRYILIREILYY